MERRTPSFWMKTWTWFWTWGGLIRRWRDFKKSADELDKRVVYSIIKVFTRRASHSMRNGKLDKVIGCDAYYFIRLFYCVGNFVPYAIKKPYRPTV